MLEVKFIDMVLEKTDGYLKVRQNYKKQNIKKLIVLHVGEAVK
jgi:hypothetical protein